MSLNMKLGIRVDIPIIIEKAYYSPVSLAVEKIAPRTPNCTMEY